MKNFVLTTVSESGDHYIYFLTAENAPSSEQIHKFLIEHGHDRDGDYTYEFIDILVEIREDRFISI